MLRVEEIRLLNQRECSFHLLPGEALQIIGPNGVGKSLLLKSLARIIPSQWKGLYLNGKDTREYVIEEWRSQVMYIPPDVVFDAEASVQEFFDEPFQFSKYKNLSRSLAVEKYWKDTATMMSLLSSGQKQQVALLRALSLNPQILLLDEPFGYMDHEARGHFLNLLAQWLTPEKGLILVSHLEPESSPIKFRPFYL